MLPSDTVIQVFVSLLYLAGVSRRGYILFQHHIFHDRTDGCGRDTALLFVNMHCRSCFLKSAIIRKLNCDNPPPRPGRIDETSPEASRPSVGSHSSPSIATRHP